MKKNNWYEVSKDGLKKLLQDKPKSFILYELIQNGWDQNTPFVHVETSWENGKAFISVNDADPNGFIDLANAYTLFAESEKKQDPTKRGRFCIGEKLVLAVCDSATICSTKGQIQFLSDGTKRKSNNKTSVGSSVECLIKMTKEDYEEMCRSVFLLIPPKNIVTKFNGKILPQREMVSTFTEILPTIMSDSNGNLKNTARKTNINIYKVQKGEKPHIYEMGIPVVETEDKFHIDIQQKVPLNMNRDNVTPAYLKKIRTCVFNNTYQIIDSEDANQTWVKEAIGDENCKEEAVKKAISLKYGEKVVAFDPSDVEANKLAVSKGYVVVPGKSFSKDEWKNIKKAGIIQPAGQVTPSNASIECSVNGVPPINFDELTEKEKEVVRFTEGLFSLMNLNVTVSIYNVNERASAWYGNWKLSYNKRKLGKKFFEDFPNNMAEVIDLIIHEFGHQYSPDHLSDSYYRGLTEFGAKVVMAALEYPEFFQKYLKKEVSCG